MHAADFFCLQATLFFCLRPPIQAIVKRMKQKKPFFCKCKLFVQKNHQNRPGKHRSLTGKNIFPPRLGTEHLDHVFRPAYKNRPSPGKRPIPGDGSRRTTFLKQASAGHAPFSLTFFSGFRNAQRVSAGEEERTSTSPSSGMRKRSISPLLSTKARRDARSSLA